MQDSERKLMQDTHDDVVRIIEILEGDVGLCQRVQENSKTIAVHEERWTKFYERKKTLAWVWSSIGGGATVLAVLQLVLGIKIL